MKKILLHIVMLMIMLPAQGRSLPLRTNNDYVLPDFMIVGVTKCGTTSLYDYICHHPKVAAARRKEVHYFDCYFKNNLDWYKYFFNKGSNKKIIGEASPGYFWKPGCARRIKATCPHTKFIVIFRDPTKRLISEYFRMKRRGSETLDFAQAIAEKSRSHRYLGAGRYIEHCTRWLELFPREQFLFLILEDVAKNPEVEVNKAFKFLGLENYKLPSYAIKNKATYNSEVIDPALIKEIKKYYEPYNKMLEAFLGRPLPWGK